MKMAGGTRLCVKRKMLVLLAVFSFFNVAWFSTSTYRIALKDVSDFYSMVRIKNSPQILIADLEDSRSKRKLIGNMGTIKFVPDLPVDDVFADHIAVRLKTKGFNIIKKNIKPEQKKISRALRKNEAEFFVSGNIFIFSFTDLDLAAGKALARSVFNITVYNDRGLLCFEKYYFLKIERNILKTPLSAAETLVNDMLTSSVDILCDDVDFCEVLGLKRSTDKRLKHYVYYDKKLSDELNLLLEKYKEHEFDEKGFIKERNKLILSFN